MTPEEMARSSERRRLTLRWRQEDHLSFSEIGARLGVSTPRARQIYMAACRPQVKVPPVKALSLSLSQRTFNTLWRAKITTAEELHDATDADLLAIRNLGVSALDEIRARFPYEPRQWCPNWVGEGVPA